MVRRWLGLVVVGCAVFAQWPDLVVGGRGGLEWEAWWLVRNRVIGLSPVMVQLKIDLEIDLPVAVDVAVGVSDVGTVCPMGFSISRDKLS